MDIQKRVEVDPPRTVRCPYCQGGKHVFVYSTIHDTFRQVTRQCVSCRGLFYYNEARSEDSKAVPRETC